MNLLAAYGLLAHALIFGALTALVPFGELRARVASMDRASRFFSPEAAASVSASSTSFGGWE